MRKYPLIKFHTLSAVTFPKMIMTNSNAIAQSALLNISGMLLVQSTVNFGANFDTNLKANKKT